MDHDQPPERIYALIQAVRYDSANAIPGAIVECGVWKGGSMPAVARALVQLHDTSRDPYLFDTFQSMSEPTPRDLDYSGKLASRPLHENSRLKCAGAPLRAVEKVLHDTSYPTSKIHFVAGDVDKTIPTGCTGFDFSLAA